MLFIVQIQAGGVGGTPNTSMLPASMKLDYLQVQSSSGTVIFYDGFIPSSPSKGLILVLG
jgi:hypothetical protein